MDSNSDHIRHIFDTCIRKNWHTQIRLLWKYVWQYYWNTGQWDEVLKLSEQIRTKAIHGKEYETYIHATMKGLGYVLFYRCQFPESKKHILVAMRVAHQIKSDFWIAEANQTYGKVCQVMGSLDQSLSYSYQALTYYKQIHDYGKITHTLRNIAETLVCKKDYQQARTLLTESQAYIPQIANYNMRLYRGRTVSTYVGILSLIQGDTEKAFAHLRKAYQIHKKAYTRRGTRTWLLHLALGILYESKKQWNKSRDHFQAAKKEMTLLNIVETKSELNIFARLLEKDLEKSDLYQEK